ncbi:MAG: hypothetical protein MI923_21375 [Phycisphaerales bacterium]|nr:hypothetical protein [Phycisphaerales bacterium]
MSFKQASTSIDLVESPTSNLGRYFFDDLSGFDADRPGSSQNSTNMAEIFLRIKVERNFGALYRRIVTSSRNLGTIDALVTRGFERKCRPRHPLLIALIPTHQLCFVHGGPRPS